MKILVEKIVAPEKMMLQHNIDSDDNVAILQLEKKKKEETSVNEEGREKNTNN